MAFFICPIPIKAQLDNNQPELSTSESSNLLQFPNIEVLAIQSYLNEHHCGSEIDNYNTAQVFSQEADKNNLDPYILPAIWYLESTCGKHQLANNGFGFMMYGNQKIGLRPFNSTADAISYIAVRLKMSPYATKTLRGIITTYNSCNPAYFDNFMRLHDEMTSYAEIYPQVESGVISR